MRELHGLAQRGHAHLLAVDEDAGRRGRDDGDLRIAHEEGDFTGDRFTGGHLELLLDRFAQEEAHPPRILPLSHGEAAAPARPREQGALLGHQAALGEGQLGVGAGALRTPRSHHRHGPPRCRQPERLTPS